MRALGIGALLVASALATLPVAAQQRTPMVGHVLDASGARVARAEVLLVHRVLPFAVGVQDARIPGDDVLRVRTDAGGRFRVEALEGVGYSGWAWWTDAEGRQCMTFPQEGVVAGAVHAFRESREDRRPAPVRVAVAGLAIWDFLGPLGFRVVPHLAHEIALPLEGPEEAGDPDAPRELALPPLPGNRGVLEVLTGAGEVLYRFQVGANGGGPARGLAPITVAVPPPARFRIRAVDAASGASIAGALVRVRSVELPPVYSNALGAREDLRATWRAVGTTGPLGTMTCRVPRPEGQTREARFLISAPGRAAVHAGWFRNLPYVAGSVVDRVDDELLVVPMHPADPVRGVLEGVDGRPSRGVAVVLRTRLVLSMRMRAESWEGPSHLVTTDEEGRFVFEDVARGAVSGSLFLVPPEADSADPRAPEWPRPALAKVMRKSVSLAADRDLETVAWGGLQEIRLEVLDVEGLPVRGARVDSFVTGARPESFEPNTWTDGRGRARLLVAPSDLRLLLATHATEGFAVFAPGPAIHTVRLRPFLELTGRALDPDGRPVAGAGVTLLLRGRRLPRRAPRDAEFLRQQLLGSRNERRFARTDAEGRFTLRLFPVSDRPIVLAVSADRMAGSVRFDPALLAPANEDGGAPGERRHDLGDVSLIRR